MNDYESTIFNNVHAVAATLCAKNRFVSTPIDSYTTLPAASLYELDSRTVALLQSSTPTENFTRATYQLDVVAETKSKCRQIFVAIDERMIQLNFIRISANYITYPDNTKVVRYVARYEAMIDPSGNIYRPY